MKASTISSIVLTAGVTALAHPAGQVGPVVLPVTFSSLSVSVENNVGTFAFSFDDPNYNLKDNRVNFKWTRPGDPPADTWTNDNHYLVSFPRGIDDLGYLEFVVKNNNAPETIGVAVSDEGAGPSTWSCRGHQKGNGTCSLTAPAKVTPTISASVGPVTSSH